MSNQQEIGDDMIPQLDKEIEELQNIKKQKVNLGNDLAQKLLTINRRNESIEEELKTKLIELQGKLIETESLFEKTKKECEKQIKEKQKEIKADYKETEKILIEHKKVHNYLSFTLNEKKEIDETRKQLIAKQDQLTKILQDTRRELKQQHDSFEREQYAYRQQKREESDAQLAQAIRDACKTIKKEKNKTILEAESDSYVLSKQVIRSQKLVASLRDQYNSLLDEANKLEMELTESKLVTQLTTPEADQSKLASLKSEQSKLEEMKIRIKTLPEAESRRKLTQHLNMMKRKRNELSGFIKLNFLKHDEMEQLRALAMNVIEQRNTMLTFLNETLAEFRKEVASAINCTHMTKDKINTLIVSRTTENETKSGSSIEPGDPINELRNYLQYFEILYARFTGSPVPQYNQPQTNEEEEDTQ